MLYVLIKFVCACKTIKKKNSLLINTGSTRKNKYLSQNFLFKWKSKVKQPGLTSQGAFLVFACLFSSHLLYQHSWWQCEIRKWIYLIILIEPAFIFLTFILWANIYFIYSRSNYKGQKALFHINIYSTFKIWLSRN